MAGAKSRQAGDSSKKDWILRVWREMPNPTTRAVAEVCECDPAYVRVVVRQRQGGGYSNADRTYRANFAEKHGVAPETARRHANPELRRQHNEKMYKRRVERCQTDPAYRAHLSESKRQWEITNYGSRGAYKKFLRERRAKERV